MTNQQPWFMLFYKNGHLLVLTIVLLLVAGLSAVQNLPRLEDPRIDNRNVIILTPFPGASAERVEVLVTDVLEDSLRQLDEISELKSTSTAGLSSISVELQPWVTNKTNEQIFSKIRDRISEATRLLPAGAATPVLDDKRGATAFTLIVALKHRSIANDTSLLQLSRFSEEMADRLRSLPGTELVRVYGDVAEEVVVELNAEQLKQAGMSFADVSTVIAAADAKQSSGALQTDVYSTRLQVGEEFSGLAALRALPLKLHDDAFLTLGDIASVKRAYVTPRDEIALVNGEEAIFIAARMRTSVRVDQWTEQAQAVIKAFEQQFQANLVVDNVFNQSEYTKARLNDLSSNLLLGCVVVMLVVLFFMGTRAALIVGLSLPLSAAFATFTLSFFNQQIHQMTIFGMILAVGLLIDNAIVITDVIRHQIQVQQKERAEAFVAGLKHLSGPLTASTLTTVLAFMPVFLLPGNVGDFVRPIAISVVMALLGSLLISLSVIAALAARYIPARTAGTTLLSQGFQWPALAAETSRLLAYLIERPWRTITLVSVFAISGVFLSTTLSNIFFPDADRDQFQVYMWLPDGSNIATTREFAEAADTFIRSQPNVKQVTWLVGGSTPSVYYNQVMSRDGTAHFANAVVTAQSVDHASALIAPIQEQLSTQFPQAKFVVRSFSQGPPVSAPIAVEIFGPDLTILAELGQKVRLAMSKTTGITESLASIDYQDSEFKLAISAQEAALVGLDYQGLSAQLFAAMEGVVGGSLLQQTEELPVRVKLGFQNSGNLQEMFALSLLGLQSTSDITLPLHSLGQWQLESKISGITRTNGQRVNNIEAFTLAGVKPIDASNALNAMLKQQGFTLPAGYKLVTAGDAGEQQEAVGQLSTFLPVLAVLMFATLILTFNSLRYALLVFTVAGLSAGFGLLSLWISGLPMGFNPLLGVAGLVGVAINGSIVVIAAVNALPVAKRGEVNEIVTAAMGSSRHILSTTVTTVGGLVPLLLFSEGSFWPPLAVVLAGGVGFSIILSLAFTPAALRLLAKKQVTNKPAIPSFEKTTASGEGA
ncbi:efflux RND transporter permease subunit [Rheinheimera baltica]|uniref:efflux RND transporter permease subunit n=1 Tax=Rheinheimera baltica TaxID=67576 RepID=UPI000413813F|nr:efflux RND transporter permease subunit [Rheinheimera baltica]